MNRGGIDEVPLVLIVRETPERPDVEALLFGAAGSVGDCDLDLSDPPQDVDRHIGAVAAHDNVDFASAKAQRPDRELIEERWQTRAPKADLFRLKIELKSQARLQEGERRSA